MPPCSRSSRKQSGSGFSPILRQLGHFQNKIKEIFVSCQVDIINELIFSIKVSIVMREFSMFCQTVPFPQQSYFENILPINDFPSFFGYILHLLLLQLKLK